jgi:hypothetical protein
MLFRYTTVRYNNRKTLFFFNTNIKIETIADRLARDQINPRTEPLSRAEPVPITISMK